MAQPIRKADKPSDNQITSASIDWYAQRCGDGTIAGAYRHLAMGIEEALEKDRRGVSLEKRLAVVVGQALWDLADRVELET